MVRPALVFALALLASGCTHVPPATAPAPEAAAAPRDGATAPLAPPPLAPPGAVGARSAAQVIRAAYGARTVTLRTSIQVNDAGLEVVGVTATGQRLFTARYDGTKISADKSPFVPASLDPARVLADMQLALWPLPAVQAAFRERGFSVSEPFAGVRRLMRDDRLLAEVHYAGADPWNGRLWFVSFEFDYSLTIDSTTTTN
jgi:uncharacterized protein DUF3261